jgi:hydroxylamine dehydrogenase
VGQDYSAAPTCATCHLSPTSDLPLTHDVGDRISWTLRPPISEKVDAKAIKAGKNVKTWQARRSDMKNVCSNCHTSSFTDNFFTQYDNAIELYNDKFAGPATNVYNKLRSSGLITADIDFDDKIEWTYFYLWHHEGRRARMGTAMFAPDYTQWHGFYEVADRFYMEFIPEVEEIVEHALAEGGEKEQAAKEIQGMIGEVMASADHKWFVGQMDAEEKARRKQAAEEFKKRYSQ